jgi:hypothetical protein
MKDLEKFLTDLPKPDVEVPAFRQQLRRELLSVAPARTTARMRFALGLTGSLAAAFALLLALFVARPAIPNRLHVALAGTAPVELEQPAMEQLLLRAATPIEADQAFLESWTAQQGQALGVRTMEVEKLFSVRQFELTDGKRMLVFTEVGKEGTRPTLLRAMAPAQVY